MHVVDGIGDVKGLIRDRIPTRKGGDKMARLAGPGESAYTVYDREIASRAQIWLREEAPRWRDKPWVLFVSFVAPHFPLTAPARWFQRYWQQDLPMPKQYAKGERPHHPFIDDYARVVDYDTHFESADDVKRAIAGYAGLVSALDENIGAVLRELRETGLVVVANGRFTIGVDPFRMLSAKRLVHEPLKVRVVERFVIHNHWRRERLLGRGLS